ncbi:hypothetical protein ckin28_04530 [Helicobacter pylori]
MILDAKFFVFILFNALSACFLSSVSADFIFKAFLYSFIWLFSFIGRLVLLRMGL